MSQDYYTVLGVNRDAAPDEIRKAYRRFARELHPDINPDPQTQERFKEITEAYEVLSKPEKRQMYDLGYITSADGVTHWVNDTPRSSGSDFESAVADAFDLFARNGSTQAPKRKPTAEDLHYAVRYESLDKVKALIASGIMPTQNTLRHAVQYDSLATVKALMASGIVPAQETLRHAVQYESLATVKVLLVPGLVPAQETLDYARRYESAATVNVLSAARAGKNPPPSQPRPQAASSGAKKSSRWHGFFR